MGTLVGGRPGVSETCIELYPKGPQGTDRMCQGGEGLGKKTGASRPRKGAQTGSAPRSSLQALRGAVTGPADGR